MFGSLVLSRRAAALIALLVPSVGAFAQTTAPLDAAQLQALCNSMTSAIGPITANYSFKNWEGIVQNQSVKFVPLAGTCVTNQPQWILRFEKRSGEAPPFKILLQFGQRGTGYALTDVIGVNDCFAVLSGWFPTYWRNKGYLLTPAQVEAMRDNAKDAWCPAMVNATSAAILKRINGQ